MKRKGKPTLPDDKDALKSEISSLKKQIYQLQMERNLLEKVAEILKKGQGINLRELANKGKAQLVDALRKMYPLILDCFDGMIVSWSIGVSSSAELVNTMLDEAISCLGDNEHPIIHSDRGCHYRWPGWITRMANARLIRSMSKKGCSPDNSACEGFFGRLKNEMFYSRSWQGVSIQQFMDELNVYLHWYNEKRIKISLGAMSPFDYMHSIGLSA